MKQVATRWGYTHHDRERPHAGIARHQRQHMPPSRRTDDQANHAGSIEARHSICADVCTTGVADGFPSSSTVTAALPERPGCI